MSPRDLSPWLRDGPSPTSAARSLEGTLKARKVAADRPPTADDAPPPSTLPSTPASREAKRLAAEGVEGLPL